MQQSSKGLLLGNDNARDEDLSVSNDGLNVAGCSARRSDKRDSGYVTDTSPAVFGNVLQFNFDLDDHFDLTLEEKDLPEDSEREVRDNSDQEVEMVLSHSPVEDSVFVPVAMPPRPPAPLPRGLDLTSDIEEETFVDEHESLSRTTHSTFYRFRERQSSRFQRGNWYFRPINNRSIGTQTPNPHSQLLNDEIVTDRFHPYVIPIVRGTAHTRLRHFSEGENNFPSQTVPSPLPDIVPVQRDRSLSLPDVPLRHQQEIEIGRELRRISDEFHYSYSSSPQQRNDQFIGSGSMPGTSRFNLTDLFESLRQFISSPTTVQSSEKHPFSSMDIYHKGD